MGRLRVIYSFPHRLGRPGIGMTAWHQVRGLVAEGFDVSLYCGSCESMVAGIRDAHETMRIAGAPLPYRVLGLDRAMAWHDWRVAQALRSRGRAIDVIHCWPSGALRTLRTASSLGVATVLERPSSHTAQVYEVVEQECQRLGLHLPKGHYARYNHGRLARQEAEYRQAQFLLCPSESAAQTFLERGFTPEKIRLHQYGYDPAVFRQPQADGLRDQPFTVIFVGDCFALKGLHFALRAWIESGVSEKGRLRICGRFDADYRAYLARYLNHPSIEVMGFRPDVARIMRECHALVLPSLSEGSALVTYEARACGLVLLVSDAAGARCTHMQEGLIHHAGDVAALGSHFRMLADNPDLLATLRQRSIAGLADLTWDAAARRLAAIYQEAAGGAAPSAGEDVQAGLGGVQNAGATCG